MMLELSEGGALQTYQLLSLILLVAGVLVGCGDKAERRESSSSIQEYADSFKDKARNVEDQLAEHAEAQRKALAAQEGDSSK